MEKNVKYLYALPIGVSIGVAVGLKSGSTAIGTLVTFGVILFCCFLYEVFNNKKVNNKK
jgi:hypothetical protein